MGKWYSCTIGVEVDGTARHTSDSSRNFPPLCPVSDSTFNPRALATAAAWHTFLEFPEVLIPINTSPGLPSASTSCAKIITASTSLEKAVANEGNPVSGIAGIAHCNFSRRSSGSPSPAFPESLRGCMNPFSSSPAQCSASAALPPFPHSSSFPPSASDCCIKSKAAWISVATARNAGARLRRSFRWEAMSPRLSRRANRLQCKNPSPQSSYVP